MGQYTDWFIADREDADALMTSSGQGNGEQRRTVGLCLTRGASAVAGGHEGRGKGGASAKVPRWPAGLRCIGEWANASPSWLASRGWRRHGLVDWRERPKPG